MKVFIELEISEAEIMSGVFDGLWAESSPWVRSTNWDWENPTSAVEVVYDTPEDDEGDGTGKKIVTAEDLGKAFAEILSNHIQHCGGMPVTAEIDEWDACVSDLVLQWAIFGEIIYG